MDVQNTCLSYQRTLLNSLSFLSVYAIVVDYYDVFACED